MSWSLSKPYITWEIFAKKMELTGAKASQHTYQKFLISTYQECKDYNDATKRLLAICNDYTPETGPPTSSELKKLKKLQTDAARCTSQIVFLVKELDEGWGHIERLRNELNKLFVGLGLEKGSAEWVDAIKSIWAPLEDPLGVQAALIIMDIK